jgi:hypothetical protein
MNVPNRLALKGARHRAFPVAHRFLNVEEIILCQLQSGPNRPAIFPTRSSY